MKNKVDIKTEGDAQHLHMSVYINGEKLPFCYGIIPNDKSYPPKITFVGGKWPNLSIENIDIDLSQYTKIAIIILQNELMKHGDLYNGFLASIISAIRDTESRIFENELAEHIIKRIIGEE